MACILYGPVRGRLKCAQIYTPSQTAGRKLLGYALSVRGMFVAACVYMVSVVVGSDLVGGCSWWDGVVGGGRGVGAVTCDILKRLSFKVKCRWR